MFTKNNEVNLSINQSVNLYLNSEYIKGDPHLQCSRAIQKSGTEKLGSKNKSNVIIK